MIIDGKKIASEIQNELFLAIQKESKKKPGLAVILVGDDPASHAYVGMKKKACARLGISSFDSYLPADASEKKVIAEIEKYNHQKDVDGILVQLPLPKHLDEEKILSHVHPDKDVDGLHPLNVGKLLLGYQDIFISCTPLGIQLLLEHYNISTQGKHVVILGRSNIVGKPLAALLMQKGPYANATVTVAHKFTQNLPELTKKADILIVAIGNPLFIKKDMVKPGAVVIDVGINKITDPVKGSKIVGDVDYEEVAPLCQAITPVPGGVGPMTITGLLKNTFLSFQKRIG